MKRLPGMDMNRRARLGIKKRTIHQFTQRFLSIPRSRLGYSGNNNLCPRGIPNCLGQQETVYKDYCDRKVILQQVLKSVNQWMGCQWMGWLLPCCGRDFHPI